MTPPAALGEQQQQPTAFEQLNLDVGQHATDMSRTTNENLSPNAHADALTPDGGSLFARKRSSPGVGTPGIGKQAQLLARRRAVAEWVQAVVGVTLPIDTDVDFRAALRDGTVLCRLLNAVRPGTIPKIEDVSATSGTGERIRSMENVVNFLKAVRALGLPYTTAFNMPDLEAAGPDERPRVAECIMALKRLHERVDLKTVALPTPTPTPAAATPPLPAAAPRPTPAETPEVLSMEAARAVVADRGADGVLSLMNQCTSMLKQRMMPTTPSASRATASADAAALDTVGPVLESVLANLTQEYEKRLLAKDQEVKAAVEGQQRLQMEVVLLQEELHITRKQLQEVKLLAGPALCDSERQELNELRAKEQDLVAHVEALSSRVQETDAAAQEQEAAAAALHEECQQLRGVVDEFNGFSERYREMSEENRRLYNQVQDLKGNIRVFCRVRPLGVTGDEAPNAVELGAESDVAVYNPKYNSWKTFRFDRVFGPTCGQEEVYEDTKFLIRSVLDGFNVCIFAYGQTGSGKTHTMVGSNVDDYSGRGINYRALDDLFALNAHRSNEVEYTIHVQLLEIYNEQLRDLLADTGDGPRPKLDIRNTERAGYNVPDATRVRVTCSDDVLHVMAVGQANRASAETKMNERSSRSHSVLTVSVDGLHRLTGEATHGCLHLIDLAGSERVLKSEAVGERLEEAKHINKSLSALGDVMAALASKSAHVPFRNSKLTQLLQDSLSGQAKAMMFVHVSPEESHHGESVSTLGFGARVSEITLGAAKKNVETAVLLRTKEALAQVQQQASEERQAAARLRAELEARQRALDEAAAERAAMERAMAEMQARLEGAPRAEAAMQAHHTPQARVPQVPQLRSTPRAVAAQQEAVSTPPSCRIPSAGRMSLDFSRLGRSPSIASPAQHKGTRIPSPRTVATPRSGATPTTRRPPSAGPTPRSARSVTSDAAARYSGGARGGVAASIDMSSVRGSLAMLDRARGPVSARGQGSMSARGQSSSSSELQRSASSVRRSTAELPKWR